jgi:hypothetical protein
MRRTVIASLSFVNGAAVATAQPLPSNQNLPKPAPVKQAAPKQVPAAQNGKCVGVVSAIGDTLTSAKIGFTVFNNEESKVPIDGWRIDDIVFGKVTTVLGRPFNLKRVSVPKGAFAVIEEDHGPFYNSAEDVRSILRKVTMATKCDQYIVIKTAVQLRGGLRVHGLGIEAGGRYFLDALFTVNLYDGKDFSLLAQHPASIGRNFLGVSMKPMREVDETWWPASDAAQSAKLRDGIRALVEESLDTTLPEILRSD